MKDQTKIFRENNVLKALIQFAVPGVITILVSELYNMVDTFFVGKYVSANAVGALGIAFPIQRLVIATSLLIGVGTSTSIARSLGEKDYDKVNKNIANAIILGLIASIVIPILIFLFRKGLIYNLGASDVIYPIAEKYISIVLIGSLFLSFTNIFGYCIIALGNPKVTVTALSIGTIVNIVLDYLLVAIFEMGVAGAAIATVSSQTIGFIYALVKMYSCKRDFNLKLKMSFDLNISRSIISIGFATFIVEISDAIVIAVLNNLLLPTGGDTAIIIVGAITRVSMFMYITIIGISSGMQPLAAYNYGAKDYQKLNKIIDITTKMVSATSVILWSGMMIFSTQIFASFIKEADILVETVKAFRTTIIVFPIIGIYYVSIYYNQAINKPRVSFFLSIYRQLLLFIPIVIVLVNTMGVKGAWITYPVTDAIAAITGVIFIKRGLSLLEDKLEFGGIIAEE